MKMALVQMHTNVTKHCTCIKVFTAKVNISAHTK